MVDLETAEAYFATCLNTSDWDDSSESDKTKALAESVRALSRLNVKTGLSIPDDAYFENAIALLGGVDISLEIASQRIKSERYTDVGVVNDSEIPLEHFLNGIASYKAWLIIRPYLREVGVIRLIKT